MNYCASCKHYKHESSKTHADVCVKFLDKDENPTPCVAARSIEGECGNDGKGWEQA